MPNAWSAGIRRRRMRPASRLPMARPAMNAANTVLAAYTLTPNTSDNRRSQSTW